MADYIIKREGRVTKVYPSEEQRIELLRAMLPPDWGDDEAMISGWIKFQEEYTFFCLTGTPEELRAKGWSGSDASKFRELMLDTLFAEAGRTQPGHKALQQLALRFFDSGLPIPERLRDFIRSSILGDLPKQKRNRPSGDMLHFQNSTLDSLFREALVLNAPSKAQAYREVAAAADVCRNTNDPAIALQRRLERFLKRTGKKS